MTGAQAATIFFPGPAITGVTIGVGTDLAAGAAVGDTTANLCDQMPCGSRRGLLRMERVDADALPGPGQIDRIRRGEGGCSTTAQKTTRTDLRTRIHDAYTGRAIHANMIVRLLPAHIGERVHLLAGRLGTHPDASAEESTHAVWQALMGMDDAQLQDVARGICFITHDLTLAEESGPLAGSP